MKFISVLLLLFTWFNAFCQQQTFDITSFNSPKGWKKENSEMAIQFTKQDEAKGTYALITLMKSIPGTNNGKENFDMAWETVVKEMVKVSAAPQMQPAVKENGWEAQSGYAPYELDDTKGVALLVTTSGYLKMVNILVLTNTDAYENDISTFLESANFTKPEQTNSTGSNNNSNPGTPKSIQSTTSNGYTYTTTNFDNGWTSTVYDDYVLTTKGNIKIYLGFIEKFTESEFAGTGKEKRHHYWDAYVSKYFTTGDKIFQRASAISDFSENFIEGWATDKQTGEKRYIGMILNVIAFTGRLSVIIASAPDEQQFRNHFPKANSKFDNDLLPMYGYNKFAVGKNDLTGTWSSNGGGTMSWYSTTTGDYAGATGAVSSDVFTFNGNGTYSSEHKGGYGVVGAMNTYQQKYQGAYTINNWELTATNRFNGKTEIHNAWFEVVKGGRMLHLDAGGGKSYTLFKEK